MIHDPAGDDRGGGAGYSNLTTRAQLVRTRAVAVEALTAYPFEVTRLRLVRHGFNTTYRVDTADGRRFALRLNVNSSSSLAHILAEQAWLRALRAETDLIVPEPVATSDGRFVVEVASPEIGWADPGRAQLGASRPGSPSAGLPTGALRGPRRRP